MMKRKIIFYFKNINSIGGVESFFYYLSKKYNNFTILYGGEDSWRVKRMLQVKRLNENVEAIHYNGEDIECDKFFCNYDPNILNKVKAKEKILIIHTLYKKRNQRIPYLDKFDKFIGVSKTVCKDFKEWTGKDIKLIYNPVEIDRPKKTLFLLSATRLTEEKGKKRMEQFIEILEKNNIPFLWLIFTDHRKEIKHPRVFFMEPSLEIINYMPKADYVVQFPDNVEGYGYTPVESLILGTPVIATKCDAFIEIGIKDGVNGFLLDFDMKNVPIDKIYKGLKKFEYEPPKSEWNKYLDNNSKYNPNKKRMVKPIKTYYDMELKKNIKKNDEPFEVTQKRANFLVTDLKTVVYDEDK